MLNRKTTRIQRAATVSRVNNPKRFLPQSRQPRKEDQQAARDEQRGQDQAHSSTM